MVVVDPMHNLFLGEFIDSDYRISAYPLLGLVKNHFYAIWVKAKMLRPTKELRTLHTILSQVCFLLFVVYFIPLPFAINVTEGTFISFVGSGMSESRGAF